MLSDSHPPASLSEVARRCHEETERFFRRLASDTQYCYDLFRRALGQRNGDAFGLLMDNYRTLVEGWVRRHSKFEQTGEEAEIFSQPRSSGSGSPSRPRVSSVFRTFVRCCATCRCALIAAWPTMCERRSPLSPRAR